MPVNTRESEYLLHLIRCAVRGETPKALPQGVSWEGIFRLARTHNLSYYAYIGAGDLTADMDAPLAEKWNDLNRKLLARHINQEHELSVLSRRFSQAGIDFMPIKGAAFCRAFPHCEAREMSDLDILLRPESLPAAAQIMTEEGYTQHEAAEHHEEWMKQPYVIVELHRSLMPERFSLGCYFSDPWVRAKAGELPHSFALSVEDEYIYMIAHAAKHYLHLGMGIRNVLDVWLYRSVFGDRMDTDYISGEITKIDLREFTDSVEVLADIWFGDASGEPTPEVLAMAHYVCNSAAYGKEENRELNSVINYATRGGGMTLSAAKRAYLFSLIYPPLYAMREKYPVLKKAPILLPVYWVARHFRLVFREPKTALSRYRRVKEVQLYQADS